MNIADIDKNFQAKSALGLNDVCWLDPEEAPFVIYGIMREPGDDRFRRMPKAVASTVNDGVVWLNSHTAGGRVRFRTDSPYIAIKMEMPGYGMMPHMTNVGSSGADLYTSDDGTHRYVGSYQPINFNKGFEGLCYTDGKLHTYTINLPLYDDVGKIYIGLSHSSAIDAPQPYTYERPIVYYGSSITQGGCASRPGNAYQSMISRRFDGNFANFGFSGNGRGEETMARYLAELDALIFVSDYDHNAPSAEHLQNTHYRLYQIYREQHPDTPYIVISKPDFRPGTEDEQRRQVIIDSYNKAIAAGDKNVYFVDGAHLFDGDCRDSCTVDGCHPNDLGFYRMAQKIGDVIGEILGKM